METETEQIDGEGGVWLPVEPGGETDVPAAAERIGLWALVLESRAIPWRIGADGTRMQLFVPVALHAAAREELRLFEAENRDWPPSAPPIPPLAENILATLSVLLLIATFYNVTLLDLGRIGLATPDWTDLGAAQAGKIVAGEWWRPVTALTLHADGVHLLSNLAVGAIFIVPLCREFGSGLAWSLIIGAGAVGNLVNAWLQPSAHSSIGASTAVFGAVGILAASNLLRHRTERRGRRLLPVAAALALLALLGTGGKNTDLGAHLFGFIVGTGLGLGTERLAGRYGRPARRVNALLALACIVLVLASWWRALACGG